MRSELQVEEFIFTDAEDAALAMKEKKQVEYLRTHMDLSKPENTLMVYEKVNKERIFRTPIGIQYLQELRKMMIQSGISEEQIPAIWVHAEFAPELRPQTQPVKQKIVQAKREELKKRLRFSLLLNLLLVIAVIAMFVITLKSDNPNILNYEHALQNRYAEWEQELTEREAAVREKELQAED